MIGRVAQVLPLRGLAKVKGRSLHRLPGVEMTRAVSTVVLSAFLVTCGGGGYSPPRSGNQITFGGLDYFDSVGDQAREYDAGLVLNPSTRRIRLENRERVFVEVPYESVKEIRYERTKHPRIAAGLLIAWPMLFLKGKKHWLTVTFQPTEEHPEGYFYARMDKSNARMIMAALEAQTGIQVEEVEE